jgi:putative transposase
MIERKVYSTDLTNEQWSHLHILLPKAQGKGQRRSPQQQRELLNAMFYVNHTGCQWRELPHDFPPWQTVYGYYEDLVTAGIWQEINDTLRRGIRQQAGRDPEPSVVIVDSQSVKTTEKKGIVADSMVARRSKGANDI